MTLYHFESGEMTVIFVCGRIMELSWINRWGTRAMAPVPAGALEMDAIP